MTRARAGGDVRYTITADDRTRKVVAGAAKRIRQTTTRVAKLGATSAAVAAAGLADLTRRGLDLVDSQAKLARQVDSSIDSIRGLNIAASDAGVESSVMRRSIEVLNQRVGEAIRGTGSAADAFERLNLDVREFEQLEADERFAVIADRVDELGLSNAQAADELRQLGIRQGEVTQLLLDGGDAIRGARDDVDSLGLSLSEVDAAQVENANDAMSRFGMVLEGIQQRLAVAFAPMIEELSARFIDVARETNGFGDTVQRVVESTMMGVARAADVVQGLRVAFQGALVGVQALGAAIMTIVTRTTEGWLRIIGVISDAVGFLVRQANRIPGVEIPTGGVDRFSARMRAAGDGMDEFTNRMQSSVGQSRDRLRELANEPMPSDRVQQFFDDVSERSRDTAMQVVRDRQRMEGRDPDGAPDGGEQGDQERREELEKFVEGLRSKEEKERESFERRMEMLRESREQGLITDERFNEIEREKRRDHERRLTEIHRDGLSDRERFQQASWSNQVGIVSDSLQNMTQGLDQTNRTMFAMQKTAALAQAVVSLPAAVMKTWERFGYPMGVPMVAAQIAAGVAQINKIKSASASGAGGVSSGAGGAGASPRQPTGVSDTPTLDEERRREDRRSGVTVSIELPPDDELMTAGSVRRLLSRVDEEAGDMPLRNLMVGGARR